MAVNSSKTFPLFLSAAALLGLSACSSNNPSVDFAQLLDTDQETVAVQLDDVIPAEYTQYYVACPGTTKEQVTELVGETKKFPKKGVAEDQSVLVFVNADGANTVQKVDNKVINLCPFTGIPQEVHLVEDPFILRNDPDRGWVQFIPEGYMNEAELREHMLAENAEALGISEEELRARYAEQDAADAAANGLPPGAAPAAPANPAVPANPAAPAAPAAPAQAGR